MINNTVVKDGVATAAKALSPGEVILTCPLFVEGPGPGALPVCLGCHKPVREFFILDDRHYADKIF